MRAISVNANPAPAAAYTKNIDAFDKRCSKSGVSRRVVHMILGATTGAYVALFAYHAAHHWLGVPSRLQPTQHGVVSIILTFYAVVVVLSAVRDAAAAQRLRPAQSQLRHVHCSEDSIN